MKAAGTSVSLTQDTQRNNLRHAEKLSSMFGPHPTLSLSDHNTGLLEIVIVALYELIFNIHAYQEPRSLEHMVRHHFRFISMSTKGSEPTVIDSLVQ